MLPVKPDASKNGFGSYIELPNPFDLLDVDLLDVKVLRLWVVQHESIRGLFWV